MASLQNFTVYPREKPLQRLFEQQAVKTPANLAVIHGERQITYRQLNEKTNQLARKLRACGVKKNQVVGIIMDRSPEAIIGILAIWKAGGAYLPIAPDYPAERINYILKDAKPLLLLLNREKLPISFQGETINLSAAYLYQGYAGTNLEQNSNGRDLACIMYTSGSTGVPKGVLLEHAAMHNGLDWDQKHFSYGESDVFLWKAPLTFVASIAEIFPPLFSGGTVCILDLEAEGSMKKIVTTIEHCGVTYLEFVPSLLVAFLEYLRYDQRIRKVASLKVVFVSGEALKIQVVHDFNEFLYKKNQTILYNSYGLTETGVDIAFYNCSQEEDLPVISIGVPIDNVRLYILDENYQSQPVGVSGALWIAGETLARGYLNREELNQEKFINHPLIPEKRIFNTGDLARWLPGGKVECLGRADNQVKIRGHRVELAEVEHYLLKHEAIQEAVAITREDPRGGNYLSAYYVSKKELGREEMRAYLRQLLPDYMVPTYFVAMPELPLSRHGKVERILLPDPRKNFLLKAKTIEPSTFTEKKLLKMWQEMLALENIGIMDNFFELGGHSLLAIFMSIKVQKEFKVEVPLLETYQNMTVQKVAALIEQGKKSKKRRSAKVGVILNFKKERHVFCLPPVTGFGFYYQYLAKNISSHSVYGLNFVESEDRLQKYISYLLKQQNEGTYLLLGYSAGGSLAFEVAKEMERLGLKVSDLILIDTEKRVKIVQRSPEALQQEIDALFHDIILKEFKNVVPDEYVRKIIEQRTKTYLLYLDSMVNKGAITANIHFIRATDSRDSSWKVSTRGDYFEYAGLGGHFYMMHGDFVAHNARLIQSILDGSSERRVLK